MSNRFSIIGLSLNRYDSAMDLLHFWGITVCALKCRTMCPFVERFLPSGSQVADTLLSLLKKLETLNFSGTSGSQFSDVMTSTLPMPIEGSGAEDL
jgi:hypothetical protein